MRNYWIKTWFGEAFIIGTEMRNKLVETHPNAWKIIFPMLRGRDIYRFSYKWDNLWIIWLFPALSLNIDSFPSIKSFFLENFDIRRLEQTGSKYPELWFNARKKSGNKWFETQDNIAYYEEFERDMIVWSDIASEPNFTIIPKWMYFNNTAYMISWWPQKYLVGILNSSLVRWIFPMISSDLWEKGSRYFKQFVELIPIPLISSKNQEITNKLEWIVTNIMEIKMSDLKIDTSILERKIDELVYQLYNLTPEEIAIIEGV